MTLALERGDGGEIAIQDAPGSVARALVETGPGPVFVWSPDGSTLAYSSRDEESSEVYHGLSIVDKDGHATALSEDPLLAYCWSPDSRTLVCLAGATSGRLLHATAITAASGQVTDLGWVRPSRDFWFMLGHFDQYSVSTALVSSDSVHVVLAASHAKDSENGVVPTVRQILARPISGAGQDLRIGRGRIASWAPA
jgi:hypothetical protein